MSENLIVYYAPEIEINPFEALLREKDIIGFDVKGNLIDSDLFDMFVKGKVYELAHEEG